MYLDKLPCQLKENAGSCVTIGTLLSRDSNHGYEGASRRISGFVLNRYRQGLETEVYHVIHIHRICIRVANLF